MLDTNSSRSPTKPRGYASQSPSLGKRGVSAPDGVGRAPEDKPLKKHGRWWMLRQARKITQRKSLRCCGLYAKAKDEAVSIVRSGKNGDELAVRGVLRCGSMICPVCSHGKQVERLGQVQRASKKLIEKGYTALFLTLTIPHKREDELGFLLDGLQRAWRLTFSGRAGKLQKERGMKHYLRCLDLTHGQNGFHPHYHAILFFDHKLTDDDIFWFEMEIRHRWGRAIEKTTGKALVSRGVRFDYPEEGDVDALSTYAMKLQALTGAGMEALLSQTKEGKDGGRTIWEILRDFGIKGEVRDLAIWREMENGTHRRRWVVASKGFLELGEEDDDDEHQEQEEVEPLLELSAVFWRALCCREMEGRLFDAVLEVTEGRVTEDWLILSRMATLSLTSARMTCSDWILELSKFP